MSASAVPQPLPEASTVIERRLESGDWMTYIHVPDDNFMLRYDVLLNGAHLGKLVLWSVAPITNEETWLSSPNELYWSPPVNNKLEALRFLLPQKPVC